MTLQYLLDENVDLSYQIQFLRQNPSLVMWVVGIHSARRSTYVEWGRGISPKICLPTGHKYL